MEKNYLIHFGILGMKWGVRKYQNEDGSLTSEGIAHYKNLHKKMQKAAGKFDREFYRTKDNNKRLALYKNAKKNQKKFGRFLDKSTGYSKNYKDLRSKYEEREKYLKERKASDKTLKKNGERFAKEHEELLNSSMGKLGFKKGSPEYETGKRYLALHYF